MIKYILNQWKSKKVTMGLIIVGCLTGNLVLSIGISISVENMEYAYDRYSGDPQEQLEIKIEAANSSKISMNILEQCKSFGEIQLLSCGKVMIGDSNHQFQVVPIWFDKEEEWHIPIIAGRYFIQSDLDDNQKQIVLGKDIAKELGLNVNDSINMNDEEYQVIGICGRKTRVTQWDNIVYVPVMDFSSNVEKYIESVSPLFLVLKSGKESFITNSSTILESVLNQGNNLSFYSLTEEMDLSSVKNSITVTIASSIIIFFIAMMNITNLMIYWIMERKKEFGILKALGGTNAFVIRCVVMEVLIMTLISALLAILVQLLLGYLLSAVLEKNNISFQISGFNLLFSAVAATICGLIAAIIPSHRAIKIKPVETLNAE